MFEGVTIHVFTYTISLNEDERGEKEKLWTNTIYRQNPIHFLFMQKRCKVIEIFRV